MASITDLVSRTTREHQTIGGFWFAKVARPVPVVETGALFVIIPDVDPSIKWGPCKWTVKSVQAAVNVAESPESAHNVNVMLRVLPAAGDEALVVFDNRGKPWVVTYG